MEFKALLQTVLDSSGIGKSDIAEVQKVLDKYHLNLSADLNKAELLKTIKHIVPELEAELKKITGIDIKIDDKTLEKSINNVIKDNQRLQTELEKTAKKAEEIAIRTRDSLNQKADKIQLSIDNKGYETQIEKVIAGSTRWSIKNEEIKKSIDEVKASYDILVNSNDSNTRVVNEEKFQAALKKSKNLIDIQKTQYATDDEMSSLLNQYTVFYKSNTKAHREWGKVLNSSMKEIAASTNLPKERLEELRLQLDNIGTSAREAGQLGFSAFDKFKNAISKFGGWTLASGSLMAVVSQIRKIPQEVTKVNAAITDLAMATGASKRELQSYIETYSNLGDELSSTVIDVTESATEWLKQGKSIAETEILIRNSMILAKDGKLSSADSTKYLTSAMKGYNIAANDTLSVVDKLSAVDMASATDVGGLAEGMSEVASSADLAGISMDKLLGYLAAIGEVTQEGMSSVGTTLNAVFARMGNIKLSRLKDYQNSGEDLSNVETVLKGVNISLRDSSDSFRDFDDVLDETYSKWSSFSEVQQRAIASAFAGTHHLNSFIVLMENYDKALNYTEVSAGSAGEAMNRFNEYQESTAAHAERLENAWIELSNTLLDSDTINFFIDLGTALTKTGTSITSLLTPLGTLGVGISAALGAKGLGLTNICYSS